jgi:hypothetical protein
MLKTLLKNSFESREEDKLKACPTSQINSLQTQWGMLQLASRVFQQRLKHAPLAYRFNSAIQFRTTDHPSVSAQGVPV